MYRINNILPLFGNKIHYLRNIETNKTLIYG